MFKTFRANFLSSSDTKTASAHRLPPPGSAQERRPDHGSNFRTWIFLKISKAGWKSGKWEREFFFLSGSSAVLPPAMR